METNKKKKFVDREVFNKTSYQKPFKFSDIKDIVQDDDIIMAGHDEGFYEENNSMESHFFMKVIRKEPETDEEYDRRLKLMDEFKRETRKRRYETYLNLKKEFEGDETKED